ncbi:hypothetical protein IEO21_03854 [Rhodonia placenta]|uniref:Uncharacterized protein n=1 Tax=Rhodonia placenta TaxID=104341 RepID=A0A8H7P4V8_9APHY|nr:hypothetical protein IEO21_03854 [Postia placenta]
MSRLVRIVPAVPPILAFHKFGNSRTKLVDAESEDIILQARTSLYLFIGGECHICGVLPVRAAFSQNENAVTHKAAQVAQHNNSSHQHTQPGGTFASSRKPLRRTWRTQDLRVLYSEKCNTGRDPMRFLSKPRGGDSDDEI